jgi:hypothetical protein
MPKYHLRANIYKRPSNPIYESSLSLRFPVSFGQSIFKFWFSNESLLSSTNQVAEDTISATATFIYFGDCLSLTRNKY